MRKNFIFKRKFFSISNEFSVVSAFETSKPPFSHAGLVRTQITRGRGGGPHSHSLRGGGGWCLAPLFFPSNPADMWLRALVQIGVGPCSVHLLPEKLDPNGKLPPPSTRRIGCSLLARRGGVGICPHSRSHPAKAPVVTSFCLFAPATRLKCTHPPLQIIQKSLGFLNRFRHVDFNLLLFSQTRGIQHRDGISRLGVQYAISSPGPACLPTKITPVNPPNKFVGA